MSRPLAMVLLLLSLMAAPAHAAEPATVSVDPATFARMQAAQLNDAAEGIKFNSELRKLDLEYRRAYLAQLIREDQHRTFVLHAQAWFSIGLTIFVVLVVVAGIYLSYLQFKATADSADRKSEGSVEAAGRPEEPVSRFMLSSQGFELSSSVIGLFVLLASMFFFYMYIKEVYPIREISRDPPAAPSTKNMTP